MIGDVQWSQLIFFTLSSCVCPAALGSSPARSHSESPSVQACLNRAGSGPHSWKRPGVNGTGSGSRPPSLSKPQGEALMSVLPLVSRRLIRCLIKFSDLCSSPHLHYWPSAFLVSMWKSRGIKFESVIFLYFNTSWIKQEVYVISFALRLPAEARYAVSVVACLALVCHCRLACTNTGKKDWKLTEINSPSVQLLIVNCWKSS